MMVNPLLIILARATASHRLNFCAAALAYSLLFYDTFSKLP